MLMYAITVDCCTNSLTQSRKNAIIWIEVMDRGKVTMTPLLFALSVADCVSLLGRMYK